MDHQPPAKQAKFSEHLFLPSSSGLERDLDDRAKDVYYFCTYEKIQIHEDMLRDAARTQSYRYAMLQNKALFQDKVVIDVGCGTGILSMFAVQAGARKVYALERSDIADQAEKLIAANGMSDKIEVVRGLAEDLELPEQADVLVSEWMGYFLLYEGMLDSVLAVRDRWLRPGGAMFPSTASLHLALLSHPELYEARIEFWRRPDPLLGGLDLSALVPFAQRCNFQEPVVDFVEPDQMASTSHTLLHLDLMTCRPEQYKHLSESFTLSGIMRGALSGLLGWFRVGFPGDKGVVLDTGPDSGQRTHWRQTMFMLNEPMQLEQDTEVRVGFTMDTCARNRRFLEFHITMSVDEQPDAAQDYLLA